MFASAAVNILSLIADPQVVRPLLERAMSQKFSPFFNPPTLSHECWRRTFWDMRSVPAVLATTSSTYLERIPLILKRSLHGGKS